MGLGCGGDIGCLGRDYDTLNMSGVFLLLDAEAINVSVVRCNLAQAQGDSDIHGRPNVLIAPITVQVLVTKQELKETETEAGGKRNEVITFLGRPGTLLENDAVTYGANVYDIRNVFKTNVQGVAVLEKYEGWREVKP